MDSDRLHGCTRHARPDARRQRGESRIVDALVVAGAILAVGIVAIHPRRDAPPSPAVSGKISIPPCANPSARDTDCRRDARPAHVDPAR